MMHAGPTQPVPARKLPFASDYMEGAHPALLAAITRTNMEPCAGYGDDVHSQAARELIRVACAAPEADVFFLVGGTQANACVIDTMLAPYQGVVAPATGHINTHEAGAVEHGGHKVLALPAVDGKLRASDVAAFLAACKTDDNRAHMVMPGLVYVSQPTEYGTLYSLDELEALGSVCHEYDVSLYLDGARLAYALASSANDVTLADIARLCDAFYIGGTKCGALIGEAVVFPQHNRVPHFFTLVKQHGALLAKGRVCGVQFEELFRDGLYLRIGEVAARAADRIREAGARLGYQFAVDSPTNQVFLALDDTQLRLLGERVDMSFWERTANGRTVMRLATSWATKEEDVDALITALRECA